MVPFVINSVLKWQDGAHQWFERVLWLDAQNVASIRLGVDQGMPVWRSREVLDSESDKGNVQIQEHDLWLPPTSRELGCESHDLATEKKYLRRQKLRDEAWEIIGKLVEPSNPEILIEGTRAKMVKEAMARTGRKKRVIYCFLRKFWQFGQTKNALLPNFHFCGGKGNKRVPGEKKLGRPRRDTATTGINLSESTKAAFALGFKKYYQKPNKTPLLSTFNKVLKEYFNCGYEYKDGLQIPILLGPDELPTYGQFHYWVQKETDLVKTTEAREGARRTALRYRALTGGGSTIRSFGPGALYQIDSTIADINLLSSVRKDKIAGRPTLYLVIDVWSRMIVGYHLTFDDAAYLCASLALENAACEKVAHCAKLGITILEEEWPAHHLPAQVVADRGELKGEKASIWTDALGIRLDNTPPYRADFKGIVEQAFRLSNDHVLRWLPGHVNKKSERGDRDTRLDARFTLEQFRWLVVKWILYHNRKLMKDYPLDEFQIAAEILPTPCDLWAWGVAAGSPSLKSRSSESLRLALLPGAKASVRSTGIYYGGLNYTTERAVKENWFQRARIAGRKPISVAFDPRDAGTLYLRPSDGGYIEPCHLVEADKRFGNCSWWEVNDHFAELKAKQNEAKHEQKQRDIELDASIEHALDNTRDARVQGPSKRKKIGDIIETRRAEKSAEHQNSRREHEKHQTADGADKILSLPHLSPQQPLTKSAKIPEGSYVPPVSNVHLFKKPKKES